MKNGGQLRVVDQETACRPSELPLVWSQQGPPGLPGEPGKLPDPEPWHEVTPGSTTEDLCDDTTNTAVFCSRPSLDGGPPFFPVQELGSGFAKTAFYKDQLGIVHLKGWLFPPIPSGSTATHGALFILPPAYRPEQDRAFAATMQVPGKGIVGANPPLAGRLGVFQGVFPAPKPPICYLY